MNQRAIRVDSMTGMIISLLAQVGVVTRRMMSVMLYRDVDDHTEQYVTHTLTISKALTRLLDRQYVDRVRDNISTKDYLYLTAEGWKCVDELRLRYSEWVRKLSVHNKKELSILVRNAMALYAGRSMRVLSLAIEKPDFGDFANKLDTLTIFEVDHTNPYDYSEAVIKNKILPCGVCYSVQEIREAYMKSKSRLLANNASQRIGMIFYQDRIITMYNFRSKNAMFSKRAEMEFDKGIYRDFDEFGDIRYAEKVAYIYSPSFVYLPTFFHGCIDGVEPHLKPGSNSKLDDTKTKFKLDKIPQYDKVYFMPQGTEASLYRQDVDQYTQLSYENDEKRFRYLRPDVTGKVIICRYPELVGLRKAFRANERVVLVGPSDPLLVDCLSRCMRTCLMAYYDVETGEEVPIIPYNKFGMPTVGNSNQIPDNAFRHSISNFSGKKKLSGNR